jgi:hypothetical protein
VTFWRRTVLFWTTRFVVSYRDFFGVGWVELTQELDMIPRNIRVRSCLIGSQFPPPQSVIVPPGLQELRRLGNPQWILMKL